jgi:hypothetical protein
LTFLLAAFTAHQVFIPTPHPAQFKIGAAPKQRGTHQPHDLAQQLLLAAQAPFDLGHQVVGEPQVLQGLLQGLGGVLRLAAITCEALLRYEAAALSGFGPSFGVSLRARHGALLRFVLVFCG